MTNANVDRGKRAEREVCHLIADQLGFRCRRGQAGNSHDLGDVFGLPQSVIQVADTPSDVLRSMREKPVAAELQRREAGLPFAFTFVRLRGGDFRVVMTVDQWLSVVRAAL